MRGKVIHTVKYADDLALKEEAVLQVMIKKLELVAVSYQPTRTNT